MWYQRRKGVVLDIYLFGAISLVVVLFNYP